MGTVQLPQCSLLIFVATPSELLGLKNAARDLSIPFKKCSGIRDNFYDLGLVGTEKVIAIETSMGTFAQKGSAAQAIYYVAETRASAVLSIGMAFGVNKEKQNLGDVMVATGVVPYDYRTIKSEKDGRPVVDYSDTITYYAREQLVTLFRNMALSGGQRSYNIHFGLFLSGGARIHSTAFRDDLVRLCEHDRGDIVIGGDMEAVGLLSASDPTFPLWSTVKGISDFADEDRDKIIKTTRLPACYNAAHFVLEALKLRGVQNVGP